MCSPGRRTRSRRRSSTSRSSSSSSLTALYVYIVIFDCLLCIVSDCLMRIIFDCLMCLTVLFDCLICIIFDCLTWLTVLSWQADAIAAPLFYFPFVSVMIFVVLNITIAIIMDGYERMRDNREQVSSSAIYFRGGKQHFRGSDSQFLGTKTSSCRVHGGQQAPLPLHGPLRAHARQPRTGFELCHLCFVVY